MQRHPVSAEHRHAADRHRLLKWSFILRSKRLRWWKPFYCKGNDPLQQNVQWSSRGERRDRPREAGAAKLGATVYPLPLSVCGYDLKTNCSWYSASCTRWFSLVTDTLMQLLFSSTWILSTTTIVFLLLNTTLSWTHRLLASVPNVKESQTSEHQTINKRTQTPWALSCVPPPKK